YYYRVRAVNAAGPSAASNAALSDRVAPTVATAASRKSHGTGAAARTYDLPLATAAATVEPRLGGPTTLVFTFSEPIRAADGAVGANEFSIVHATFSAATIAGTTLTLNLSGIADQSL